MGLLKRVVDFLGLGRMPAGVRAELEADGGIVYLAEGVRATAVLRDFRAPGYYCCCRIQSFVGFLAVSERRIRAYASCYDRIDINAAFDDARFDAIAMKA